MGRLPQKISAQASFTADQWRNWVCLFSLYCLHGLLPSEHYSCMLLFVRACTLILQPVITVDELNKADNLLMQFCKRFQELYGDDKCTPNMHLHCHLHQTIIDYGPVHSSWCFAFERFNDIFESFQKNWIHLEVQLMAKFLRFQDMAILDTPFEIPHELTDILQAHSLKVREIVQGQGSLLATHIDSLLLASYMENVSCPLDKIDASEKEFHCPLGKKYEKLLPPEEVQWLKDVYLALYPQQPSLHVPMLHEVFHEINVLGEHYCSEKCKGRNSPVISAYWAGATGNLLSSAERVRAGTIQGFFLHTISLTGDGSKHKKISHVFAKVRWHRLHPR